MKQETIRTRKAFFVGFIMTLILCSFFLFAGLALWNTAQDLFGDGTPLVEMSTGRSETPEVTIKVIDTEYEVDLSGLNEAARLSQAHYPLIPQELRAAGYVIEELKRGLEALQQMQEKSDSGGKIFVSANP